MNPVEIEQAVTALVEESFEAAEFPYAFLEAFGNNPVTIKRLQTGSTNRSDVDGGVLQRNNIHVAPAEAGQVAEVLSALRDSPVTPAQKARFILATDGDTVEAEDLTTGETIACDWADLPNHFGFFLPLAGISTVKQIRENTIDIRATGNVNKLYVELLKHNPEWGTEALREDMNHFMARLIFCFFAEDTGIFSEEKLFTNTVMQMSASDSSDTHKVIAAIFNAMARTPAKRAEHDTPTWADRFPYVNGGLFSKIMELPRFSRAARSYLGHVGRLPWQQVNPDIFGSMIQAIVEEDERGSLGMHYTSVPNILKVLNPLFLDDLRQQLEEAGDNKRKLLNLRKRMSRIRVFDPAAGSGNFLVIAYKQMREIEAEINKRRGEPDRETEIPLTNFRGIEIKSFSAEIARLALIIAEYQCDVLHRSFLLAQESFLPLKAENWITCGNALRLDWLSLCPPTGREAKHESVGLFPAEEEQTEIDFENEGGETYICGNPPFAGHSVMDQSQKADLELVFSGKTKQWRRLDYVSAWFMKAIDYGQHTDSEIAFVTTNSLTQGQQVPVLWPLIFRAGYKIFFAHTSFRWSNLARHNAGVTVAIIGLSKSPANQRLLYEVDGQGTVTSKRVDNINAYLTGGPNLIVQSSRTPGPGLGKMDWGNKATDGGNLVLSSKDRQELLQLAPESIAFIKRYIGSQEFIRGQERYCLWITDEQAEAASRIPAIQKRIAAVADMRLKSKAAETRPAADYPHRFRQIQGEAQEHSIIVPRVSSETRHFLPVGLVSDDTIVSDAAFALYDAPLWNLAVIASRLHLVWIGAVCGKLETRYRYSNTLGWNTFPMPPLTEKNKADLTHAAEDILLIRESHFPKTIADLYDPEAMPADLRQAHERNDEIIERIFIGRRFRNDTERLEKLFALYAKAQERPASGKVKA